jgi:outer membrane protein OmpA-like peptidoglycan-associated protein
MKALITPEMMNRASALLGEKQANVSNAVSTIIPSLLGLLLKKEHSPQLKNIMEEAGNLNIASDIKPLFEGKPSKNQQNIGDDFLQHLLGNRAADFTAPIAGHANISKVAANRLISMVAPLVAGFLGNRVIKEKLTMPQLVHEISGEKVDFEGLIPTDLIKAFDLYPKLKIDNEGSKTEAASATNNQAKMTAAGNSSDNQPEKTKKGNEWIIWIILLVLFLILFLWWKSCRGEKNETYTEQETVMLIEPEIGASAIMTELTLPNGVKLNAYVGGIEDRMINFLESDEYKKATNETLKDKWFEFDNIDFVSGSSTELESGSNVRLENIIAILKYFKDAKVMIAAFDDVAENEKLSRERAKTIASLLEKGGVGSQVVKIQDYGNEFAVRSPSESNMERIALRFVK